MDRRLTETRTENGVRQFRRVGDEGWLTFGAPEVGASPMMSAIQRLADYEDAEEQGLLVRLPCKAGDTVYVIDETTPPKVAKAQWVSVNDRLPDVNSDNGSLFIMPDWCGCSRSFIACYKDGDELKVRPLSFYVDEANNPHWTVYNNVFHDWTFPVLYWMELPAPPAD